MNYSINVTDGKIAVRMSKLQLMQRRHINELKPIYDIQFQELARENRLTGSVKKWLENRKQELFPAYIKPFSKRDLIYKKAQQISRFIREIEFHGLVYDDDFWMQLNSALNLIQSQQPLLRSAQTTAYWYKKLRRQVRRASFIYSSLAGDDKSLATHKYVMYRRYLTPTVRYETPWGTYTTAQLNKRRQHARHSSYLARTTGIAELNIEAGRLPYFITVTVKPEFKKTNAMFNGDTPDQILKKISSALRNQNDKLRYHDTDLDAVRVFEAQADGTPHVHFLVFTDDIALIMQIVEWAFVERQKISVMQGIHMTPVYDLNGIISYILKSFLPEISYFETDTIPDEIKAMEIFDEYADVVADKTIGVDEPIDPLEITHGEQIQAWSEFTSSRRFGVISIKRHYPPLAIWDACRKGCTDLVDSPYVKEYFLDAYKTDLTVMAKLNHQLNDIAASGDYAMFCRLLWLYTGDSAFAEQLMDHNNIHTAIPDLSDIQIDQLSIPAHAPETPDNSAFPQLWLSNQVNLKSNKRAAKGGHHVSLKPVKNQLIWANMPDPHILCTH